MNTFLFIAYSLALLSTRAQCDAVLAFANGKLRLLTYQNTQTDHRAENLTASATSVATELRSLNAYLPALTPVVTGRLPAGHDRAKQENELRVKTDRRDALVALPEPGRPRSPRRGRAGPEPGGPASARRAGPRRPGDGPPRHPAQLSPSGLAY